MLAFAVGVLPLWLSSVEMWDGVVGMHALTTGDWTAMKGWALDSNWYLVYGLFLLADATAQLTGLAYWVFFKLWIVLMVAGIVWEVRRLATDVFEVPSAFAAWLPALVFSFPVWYVFFSYTCMLGHLTCVWLALAGYRLLARRQAALCAAGLLFTALSFQLASNCVFVLALELGRWWLHRHTTGRGGGINTARSDWSYRRSILLLLLSVGVFAATRVVWPPAGTYAGYNQLLSPLQAASWVSYAKYAALVATWLLLLVPVLAALCWRAARRSPEVGGVAVLSAAFRAPYKPLPVLVGLMFAAALPYIAVGVGSPLWTLHVPSASSVSAVLSGLNAQGPVGVWYGGWGARHLLVMMVPMLVLAAWLAGVRGVSQSAMAAMVALGLAFGAGGHWAKLQRIAKEHTIVRLLASQPPLPHGQVNLLLEPHEDYVGDFYEANDLLYRAYRSTHWAALIMPEVPAAQAWCETQRSLKRASSEKDRALVASLNLMGDFTWDNPCTTTLRIKLPPLSAWDVLWRAEHAPELLPPARATRFTDHCPDDRQHGPNESADAMDVQKTVR